MSRDAYNRNCLAQSFDISQSSFRNLFADSSWELTSISVLAFLLLHCDFLYNVSIAHALVTQKARKKRFIIFPRKPVLVWRRDDNNQTATKSATIVTLIFEACEMQSDLV